jgi:hypothetical protein
MIRFWSSVWKSFFVKLFFRMSHQELVIFFFFNAILGFKLRTLCFLGRLSTSWATLPSLFALDIFEIGICFFCLGQSGSWSFCYKLIDCHSWEMTGMNHCAQLLVEMGSHELFACLGHELWSSLIFTSCLSSSQDYSHDPLASDRPLVIFKLLT